MSSPELTWLHFSVMPASYRLSDIPRKTVTSAWTWLVWITSFAVSAWYKRPPSYNRQTPFWTRGSNLWILDRTCWYRMLQPNMQRCSKYMVLVPNITWWGTLPVAEWRNKFLHSATWSTANFQYESRSLACVRHVLTNPITGEWVISARPLEYGVYGVVVVIGTLSFSKRSTALRN